MNKRGFLASIGGMNILLLGLVSFFNDVSSEMILPLLPLLITSLGGSGLAIGFIGGLMQGLPEILKVFSGYFSDRVKHRRRFIFFGYLTSQLGKLSLFFAFNPFNVLFSESIDKAGKGIRETPRDALISESLPHEAGRAFAIQRVFDKSGAILGNLLVLSIAIFAGVSIARLSLIKSVIIFASIIGFFSLVPILFLKEGKKLDGVGRNDNNFLRSVKLLPKAFWIFVGLSIVFAFANFSYMFFILRASSFFNHSPNYVLPVIPILLYVFFNLAYTAFAIPFGELSDRIGRIKVLMIGGLLLAITCAGFLFVSNVYIFVLLFILYGMVYSIMISNQKAFVSDLSFGKIRATALGIFQTSVGLASIIAGVVAGKLYDLNNSYLFAYGLILSLTYVVFMFLFRKSCKC